MSYQSSLYIAIPLLISAQASIASTYEPDQEIVISASRVDTKRVETGNVITVLDHAYLEENQYTSVEEALRDVAGLSVARSGGLGKQTSVFIRGGGSKNTLIIIDGVRVNDLSSANGGFDFGNLMADNIERIEILKGSQSALFGGDAMGGVINIITKKGKEGFTPSASFDFGLNGYNKQNLNVRGGNSKTHYSFSAVNLHTDGIDTTDKTITGDDDGYKNQTLSLIADTIFNDHFSIDGVIRYTDVKSEYDGFSFTSPILAEKGSYSKYYQKLAKINGHFNFLENRWQNRISLSYLDVKSQFIEPANYTENSGENVKIELQSDYFIYLGENVDNRFTFAIESEKIAFLQWGAGNTKQKMNRSAIVGEYSFDWEKKLFITTSVRRDIHSDFNNRNTYKIAASAWLSDGIRAHTSQGTGVKNPTFSQLNSAPTGLKTETSESFDLGLEYNFNNIDGYIDLIYFDSKYKDTVGSVWVGPGPWDYKNYNKDESAKGIEFTVQIKPTSKLRINAMYTNMKTDDGTSFHQELLKRPNETASINANYKFTSKFNANVGVRYIGKRLAYGPAVVESQESYNLVNLAAGYTLTKHVTFNARIENLFDNKYQDVLGYNTQGIEAYIGVSFK